MPLPKLDNKPFGGGIELPNLDDENIFKTVTPEEIEQEEYEEEVEQTELPRRYNIPRPYEEEPIEEEPPEVRQEKRDKFIDKKNKKIIPTGGKASKIKARAGDYDDRKNSIVWLKMMRVFIFIIIIAIFGIGIKNTWFPEQIYTPEEIEYIAKSAVGNTGFPLDRGRAFSQEFLYYYLKADAKDKSNKQYLSYFYEGKIAQLSNAVINKTDPSESKQRPIYMPILFDEFTPTEYTGVYKYSVLMSDTDGTSKDEDSSATAKWMSFSINVYYDKETDMMSIHPDSPTIIPSYNITNSSKLPNEKPLGNGERDEPMMSELASTIEGFIVAYSKVDPRSHSEIDQYIPANPKVELVSGFGGSVKLAKNTKSSIIRTIYKTDNPNEWKVDVKVEWLNNQVSDLAGTFTSRYVMTIQKTADDVYLVTKFVPYTFIREERTTE